MRIRADDTEQTVTDALSLLVDDYERARTFLAILAEAPERAVPLRARTLPELVKSLRVLLILEEEIIARDELFAMAARMRARRAAIESSEDQSDLHGCLQPTREAAEEAGDWDEPDCCS